MKLIRYSLILLAIFSTIGAHAGSINFDGDIIEIEGSFDQLAVHGSTKEGVVTVSDLLNGTSLLSDVAHTTNGPVLKLTLSGNHRLKIEVPNHVSVLCRPTPIVYEGSYIFGRDARHIHLQDTDDEIEIHADGYRVTLHRTSGSISVVSYENISAILPNLAKNSIVSLDSYLGDILLRIPHTLDPKIKATAPKGSVTIKGENILFEPIDLSDNPINYSTNAGNQIILHAESGSQIFVTSLEHLPNGPSHPELRDRLIKMYIEDQGKNRMDNESRTELTAMGFGPYIEALDDVYKGHLYSQKHRDELDRIVDKYGFPTEEMVGFQYALGAVQLIIFQSEKTYFDKYRKEFTETFGQHMTDMYDRTHK